jgi:acetyl/propionyl-CoA carboxylase alpha subunit
MRVVRRQEEIEQALAGAQREGSSYFGDSQVYVEKYLDRPRHIEVQILADRHGNVVHLGERDCSSQRRHQKLLEESPAANLDPLTRERLLSAAVKGAASIGYTTAGTVECLVAGDDFYFLEMNTRVQVEHPVTEFVTGVDIVKEQILVASGEPLSFSQSDVSFRGHSIECRINAEDPAKNFIPSPGTITSYREPQMPWVRVDSACYPGYQILPFYDSLLAKLVVWGRTREEAIVRTRIALESFEIKGVATTIPFHLMLLEQPAFRAGSIYTTYVESELKESVTRLPAFSPAPGQASPAQSAGAGGAPAADLRQGTTRRFEINVNQRHFNVAVTELVSEEQASCRPAPAARSARSVSRSASTPASVARPQPTVTSGQANHAGEIRSAMHGIVKQVLVSEGQTVKVGEKLLIFEAMKMESEILSDRNGKVLSLKVKPGETVEASGLLLVLGE